MAADAGTTGRLAMTSDRWLRIKQLFHAALERAPARLRAEGRALPFDAALAEATAALQQMAGTLPT